MISMNEILYKGTFVCGHCGKESSHIIDMSQYDFLPTEKEAVLVGGTFQCKNCRKSYNAMLTITADDRIK